MNGEIVAVTLHVSPRSRQLKFTLYAIRLYAARFTEPNSLLFVPLTSDCARTALPCNSLSFFLWQVATKRGDRWPRCRTCCACSTRTSLVLPLKGRTDTLEWANRSRTTSTSWDRPRDWSRGWKGTLELTSNATGRCAIFLSLNNWNRSRWYLELIFRVWFYLYIFRQFT